MLKGIARVIGSLLRLLGGRIRGQGGGGPGPVNPPTDPK